MINKFCKTCKIWRPERSSHWSIWDWCVETFDHHCPFLNNCIGKRNYRYFFGFLCSITLNGLGIIAWLIIYISSNTSTDESVLKDSLVTEIIFIIIGAICAILLIGIIIFWIFHLCLIFQGKTTREKIKRKASKSNCKLLFCFIRDPPNFNGGNQWLTKLQYEMYLAYCREVREGRVLEHCDPRIQETFIKQRRIMEKINIETMNKQQYQTPLSFGMLTYLKHYYFIKIDRLLCKNFDLFIL